MCWLSVRARARSAPITTQSPVCLWKKHVHSLGLTPFIFQPHQGQPGEPPIIPDTGRHSPNPGPACSTSTTTPLSFLPDKHPRKGTSGGHFHLPLFSLIFAHSAEENADKNMWKTWPWKEEKNTHKRPTRKTTKLRSRLS